MKTGIGITALCGLSSEPPRMRSPKCSDESSVIRADIQSSEELFSRVARGTVDLVEIG